jgi:uncharacterized membrane protein
MDLLEIATTLCIGPMIGAELAVSVFVNPVLRKLDKTAESEAVRLFARRLGAAMPFWYIAGLLLLITETIVHRHSPRAGFFAAATGIWAAAILLTLLFLVPINNRLAKRDPGALTEIEKQQHQRWDSLHRYRVAGLFAAMVMFLAGIR